MMTILHAMRSMQVYGESAIEVHIWIDQFWNGDPHDHSHRIHLHNSVGRILCHNKFGEWALPHFDLHMADDGIKLEDKEE